MFHIILNIFHAKQSNDEILKEKRIFCVPTPLAIPLKRVSTRRMIPQRSAHALLIIVI